MEATPPSSPDAFRTVAVGIFLLIFGVTVVFVVASFPAGLYAVFSDALSTSLGYRSLVLPFFWVGPVPEAFPFEVSIGAVFSAFSAVYAGMLILSAVQRKTPLQAIRSSLRDGIGTLLDSPFIAVLVAIGFLEFTSLAVDAVSQAALGPITNPYSNLDPLVEFGALALAPLREEIGFRLFIIGIAALVFTVGASPRAWLRALWRPSAVFEGGAGGAASIVVWAATLGSAVIFGIIHVAGNGGASWPLAKLPDAVWGGVVLGYLYVRYGLHVAVLTHWGLDYLSSAFSYFGQAAYGISANSLTTMYWVQYLVDYDLLQVLGLFCFLLVVYLVLKRVWATGQSEGAGLVDKPPQGGPPPAP